MVITQGRHPVDETVRRIEAALAERGLTLFARIDHAAGAREAGLDLADEVVLLFGDPRAGTLLMQEAPAVGIALPLRMLVWLQDGVTRIGFEEPGALAERFGISGHADMLEQMHLLLDGLAAAAEGGATETAV
jgi:uncharacterized protein (DUF302 family)